MIKNKEKFNEPEIRQVSITEVETKINEYNDNILSIEDKYNYIKPVNMNVLVRCYMSMYNTVRREPIGNKGEFGNFVNPFPFDSKAIIVAASENSQFKKGDHCLINKQAIELLGNKELGFTPVYGFVSQDYNQEGYLLIPEHFIKCII